MRLARRRVAPAALLAAAAVLVAASGCSGGGSSPSGSASAPPSSVPGAPSPDTARTVGRNLNPLTGLKATKHPVIAVKIDDTAAGRPQRGVDQADIVYVKQVEGGLTRLLAVFNSRLPVVEPVRSTRADDPQLVMEYGPIDYVASGGDRAELAPLIRSNLRADLDGTEGIGFSRDPARVAPFNLRVDLAAVAKSMKGPGPRPIGLIWSRQLGRSPTAAGVKVRTTVGGTPVAFDWKRKSHRYERLINGAVQHAADGNVIATPNVVVQFCHSTVYRKDIDTAGNPAQWTHTLGSGKAVVFRNGRRIVGTWSRPSVKSGTALRDARGAAIPLAPGGAWFVQVAAGTRLG